MNFSAFSTVTNLAVFFFSAGLVWYFGAKLSIYVDAIAVKTGISHGFLGALLLGGITSLPEMATVGSASFQGNAPLALNNLFGTIANNFLFLAFADVLVGREALTSVVAQSFTLLQGVLSVLLLVFVGIACTVPAPLWGHVSTWSAGILALFTFFMWLASRYPHRDPWVVRNETERHNTPQGSRELPPKADDQSTLKVAVRIAGAGFVVLVAGIFLAQTSDALARQTGVSSGMVGMVLLAMATGLPELSTTYTAVRIRRYEMALGNVFGTNLWNVAIVAFGDLLFREGAIYESTGNFEILAIFRGIAATSIFLLGLLERKDKTLFRMGYDSLAVLFVYFGGIWLLYLVSGGSGT